MTSLLRTASLMAFCLLAACASAPQGPETRVTGSVGYEGVALDDDNRLQIEPGRFTNADPPVGTERILPEYPVERLPDALPPLPICAELWIDAEGVVTNVEPVVQAPECPEVWAPREDFDHAVAEAARQWDFLPAFVCEDSDDGGSDLECHGNGRLRYIPIRLTYRFVFTRTESGGSVSVEDARR
ncbi:MAG: energy transducer TonB [Lysobacteraceae bacterium]